MIFGFIRSNGKRTGSGKVMGFSWHKCYDRQDMEVAFRGEGWQDKIFLVTCLDINN